MKQFWNTTSIMVGIKKGHGLYTGIYRYTCNDLVLILFCVLNPKVGVQLIHGASYLLARESLFVWWKTFISFKAKGSLEAFGKKCPEGWLCGQNNHVLGVEVLKENLCPGGGGIQEKNMSYGWRGARNFYVLGVGGPEIFCLPPLPEDNFWNSP